MGGSSNDLELVTGELGPLPYFAIGSGSNLVVLRGFTTTHTNPTGVQLRFELRTLRPLARRFRVYAVNRPPGLRPGTTMADLTTIHSDAFRAAFGGPIDLLGMSSGGSIALQVAADHPDPDVVRRLVLVAAGYQVGQQARAAQMRYIEAVAAGRRGAQHLASMKVASRIGPGCSRLSCGSSIRSLDRRTRPTCSSSRGRRTPSPSRGGSGR